MSTTVTGPSTDLTATDDVALPARVGAFADRILHSGAAAFEMFSIYLVVCRAFS